MAESEISVNGHAEATGQIHDSAKASSLELPPNFLDRLQNAPTPHERQAISDGVFTQERREKMLAGASKDRNGRPVRYYRRVGLPNLYKMLEKGEQTAYDYFDDLDTPIKDDPDLVRRLGEFAAFRRYIDDDEEYDVWSKLSLSEAITKLSQLDPTLPPLPASPTHRQILEFMEQLPLRFVARVHSGSLDQRLSPYLSLSVGGPIDSRLYPERPVAEFALPDNHIYLQPDSIEQEAQYGLVGVNGEKEVLAKQLPLASVAAIYFNPKKYRHDFIESDTSVAAAYRKFNEDNPIEGWRWNTTIFDYLPKDIAEKALEEYSAKQESVK